MLIIYTQVPYRMAIDLFSNALYDQPPNSWEADNADRIFDDR
jgi:hypothetical protein